MNETIPLNDGTVFKITGTGSNANMDSISDKCMHTLVSAVVGAPLITNDSGVLVDEHAIFTNNTAMGDGGALYVPGNSDV